MNSPHDDAVLNFDLDFLHPSTNNIPVQVLKQRYITQLKRRIIRVDALQNHRNSINQELSSKTKELEDVKKKFETITQEYTQTSLEYKEALETCTKLEKETQRLKILLKIREDERFKAVSELEAIQSHTAQLEQLVKQQERKIDHLDRYEKKHVDKLIAEKTKDYEKEILLWKRKYEALRKQLQDKKKSNKESLHKYDRLDNEIIGGAILSDEHSDNEDNTSVDFTVPSSKRNTPQNNARMTQTCQIPGKDNIRIESDTDCSHEVVSVDTGCGSSLSSSDNEKWLNSPDFVFSPIHVESIELNRGAKGVNTATSPLPSVKMVEVSTSPIPLVKTVNVGTSANISAKVIDVATSPITIQTEKHDSSVIPKPTLVKIFSELHHDIKQPSTIPEGSIVLSSENMPCVVIESIPDNVCSNNKGDQESIIDDETDSTVQSIQTIYIDIEDIKEEDIKEEECLDNNMEEDCVIDYENDLVKSKSVEDAPDIEVQTTPQKEFLNKELAFPISDDEICYGALKHFDKLPCVLDTEDSKNKTHGSRIFDEIRSPPLEITPKSNQDRKNNDDPIINSQTNSMEVETSLDIESKNIDKEVIECSNNQRDEDSKFSHKIEDDCVMNNEVDINRTNKHEAGIQLHEVNEKTCLELNNSAKTNEDRSTDNEIEMILSTMRIQHKLITPIPRSPKSSNCVEMNVKGHSTQTLVTGDSLCADAAIAREYATAAKQEAAIAKKDAAKTREDNKKLMAVIDTLFKDVCTIKKFLKDQFSFSDSSLEHVKKSLSSNNLLDKDNINLNNMQVKEKNDLVPLNDHLCSPVTSNKIKILSDVIIRPANTNGNGIENQPCGEKNVTNPEIKCDMLPENQSDISLKETVNEEIQLETKDALCEKSQKCKKRKLTNLDKYRKQCELRKYKIKSQSPPLIKSRMKAKRVRTTKKVTDLDTAATLNDTNVYAKAVKVMAELNSKMHKKCSTGSVGKSTARQKPTVEESKTEIKDRQNIVRMSPDTSSPPGKMDLSQANTFKPVVAYPRRSMRSPGLVLASPKPINFSPKHSTNSAVDAAVSATPVIKSPRGSIKSPKSSVTSTKPMVMSPTHAKQSLEIAVTSPTATVQSPRASIKSPEVAVTSTKPMVKLPRHSIQSPEFAATSPTPAMKSLRSSIKSPEIGCASAKPTVTSPRRSIKFLERLPTCRITSPGCAIISAEPNVASSIPSTTSPKRPMKQDNVSVTSQKAAIMSPKRSITSPEFVVVSPKTRITSPRRSKKIEKLFGSSPTPGITSQKSSITSPELVDVSLKRTIPIPKRFIQYPGDTATSPTFMITSPQRLIRSPEVDIAPNPRIMSPSRHTKSTDHTVASLNPAVSLPRRSIMSPVIDPLTPKPPAIISTKHNQTASRPFITSPEAGITYSELNNTCSGSSVTQPETAVTSSRMTLRSPKANTRSSKQDITNPKLRATSPTLAITSSKVTITSSKLSVTTPKMAVTTPKLAVTSTEVGLTSPKNTVRSPQPGIISPKLKITSPKLDPKIDITSSINTRCRSKLDVPGECSVVIRNDPGILDELPLSAYSTIIRNNSKENHFKHEPPDVQKSRKRTHSDSSNAQCTRVLRSKQPKISEERTLVCYSDGEDISRSESLQEECPSSLHPKETILCYMIEKYAVKSMKQRLRQVSDATLKNISAKIETYVDKVKETSSNKQQVMDELVQELQKYKHKDFVSGLVHYVSSPIRRLELHTKTSLYPAPQMTKSEEVLLYVIKNFKTEGRQIDFVETILSAFEFVIFKINRTPEFEVIESTSHFYALVCRYFNLKNRLIAYMLDAMYCILFKAVPLIRQCLDVWPHVIPLAHMSVAKSPLVTCFVYLLHFYKCEDKFNRVQDIRSLLARKYFYEVTEWNETKILEYFNNAIRELRNVSIEKKMLRIALIILSKRNGPKWTQNHIIKKMLLPFIEDEKIPVKIQEFCISMLGPLMKPYPVDMKVHCEIVMNKLTGILSETKSQGIEEAALTSFIIMNRHDIKPVVELLLSRKMQAMSPEFEKTLCTFVRSKPLNGWLKYLKHLNKQIQTYNN